MKPLFYPIIWIEKEYRVQIYIYLNQRGFEKWNLFLETFPYNIQKIILKINSGYNIVGDGTPQAYIPILTGQTEEELPLTRKRFKTAKYVDEVYPFIWKNFSDAGYATLYGEDAHNIGNVLWLLTLMTISMHCRWVTTLSIWDPSDWCLSIILEA